MLKSLLSLAGICVLAGTGGFLTSSWTTGTVVFVVLSIAAWTAGDLKIPGLGKSRP